MLGIETQDLREYLKTWTNTYITYVMNVTRADSEAGKGEIPRPPPPPPSNPGSKLVNW